MNYEKLQIDGYDHFNDPRVFTYLEWFYKTPFMITYQGVKYPITYWPIGVWLLRMTQKKIDELILSDELCTFGNVDAWRGIDNKTDVWHTDHIEGSNLAFLMYLTDMDESTGGGIQIKRANSSNYATIYPKKYDIVVLNQNGDQFRHKVINLKQPINRDVANIEFNIMERL
jgi:hypothetical protein